MTESTTSQQEVPIGDRSTPDITERRGTTLGLPGQSFMAVFFVMLLSMVITQSFLLTVIVTGGVYLAIFFLFVNKQKRYMEGIISYHRGPKYYSHIHSPFKKDPLASD